MNNPNSFVALAYIQETNNPLKVFCNIIVYTLHVASKNTLLMHELIDKIYEMYGLKLPIALVKSSANILKKEKRIEVLPYGQGYHLINAGFNISDFEKELVQKKENEYQLINNMNQFIKTEYDKDYSEEELREALGDLLHEGGVAASFFLDNNLEEDSSKLKSSWYIREYIKHISNEKNIYYEYLVSIIKGIIIYIGISQTENYDGNKLQKYKGTVFFVDTKLLLRILGYSNESSVVASKELTKMLIEDCEAKIGVFEHTVKEVRNALLNASYQLKSKGFVEDFELRSFKNTNNYDSEDFKIAADSVETNIKAERSFEIVPDIDWNNEKSRLNNLDWKEMYEYIHGQQPTWKESSIHNDIKSINHINVLREGNYLIDFGGTKKLPIFVTTNHALCKMTKSYIYQKIESGELVNWDQHRIPIITDEYLTYKIWLPRANKYGNLPILKLSQVVSAAQQYDEALFEKIKEAAVKIRSKHRFNIIDLDSRRLEKITSLLIKKSNGDLNIIDDDFVAYTFDELLKNENERKNLVIEELHQNVAKKDSEIDEYKIKITEEKQRIVHAYAAPYINKLGLLRICVLFFNHLWFPFSIISLLIQYVIQIFVLKDALSPKTFGLSILLAISWPTLQFIGCMIGKISTRFDILSRIKKRIEPWIRKKYIKKTKKKLNKTCNLDIIDTVANYANEKTEVFKNNS